MAAPKWAPGACHKKGRTRRTQRLDACSPTMVTTPGMLISLTLPVLEAMSANELMTFMHFDFLTAVFADTASASSSLV